MLVRGEPSSSRRQFITEKELEARTPFYLSLYSFNLAPVVRTSREASDRMFILRDGRKVLGSEIFSLLFSALIFTTGFPVVRLINIRRRTIRTRRNDRGDRQAGRERHRRSVSVSFGTARSEGVVCIFFDGDVRFHSEPGPLPGRLLRSVANHRLRHLSFLRNFAAVTSGEGEFAARTRGCRIGKPLETAACSHRSKSKSKSKWNRGPAITGDRVTNCAAGLPLHPDIYLAHLTAPCECHA